MSATTTARRIMVSFAALALATACTPAEDQATSPTVEVLGETSEDAGDEGPEGDYRVLEECEVSTPTMEPC